MKSPDYFDGLEEGYSAGKHDAIIIERRRQHRYAWFTLFCLIVVGAFVALFIWNLIGMFV